MPVHATLSQKCKDMDCLEAGEDMQDQGGCMKSFAQIGWVILGTSLQSDCEKANAFDRT